jgi:hypothetical protein
MARQQSQAVRRSLILRISPAKKKRVLHAMQMASRKHRFPTSSLLPGTAFAFALFFAQNGLQRQQLQQAATIKHGAGTNAL